ncbi:transcription antitermination factor NusB [Pseudofulvimonas gallinarii]|uniref:Transcription antitermination protein NusB n=1 Tax=Pseudofulvimonas gallinarii TaxID=634155 RepID=A0A4R3LLI3_9GAMM|nr:transcription antitermination factor NusB [Pseudofulvimonas gallinarii]TCT00399.1 NusB antitermination factor [Pseudofulvimonas gallinarii]THD12371.1 N utilization substance protein B [Pseudofulvimonas gallinarii]
MSGGLDRNERMLRTRARRRALQALYAWQLSGYPMRQVEQQFAHEQAEELADLEYFHAMIFGVENEREELDAALRPFLDRDPDLVDAIERAILRLGAWELRHRMDVPYRVVINEALELAKRFGNDQGHAYVNGVLDQLAARERAAEYRA